MSPKLEHKLVRSYAEVHNIRVDGGLRVSGHSAHTVAERPKVCLMGTPLPPHLKLKHYPVAGNCLPHRKFMAYDQHFRVALRCQPSAVSPSRRQLRAERRKLLVPL
jgi:hypothetical protein